MKPIFNKEREFLKENGINIPDFFWRDGSKIYINANDEIPVIVFKVDELLGKIQIKQNFIESVDENKIHIIGKYKNKKFNEIVINKTWQEEIKENEKRINKIMGEQISRTISYLNSHTDSEIRLSISGGKDSSVMNYIFKKFVLPKLKNKTYYYDGFNTTNDTADTYRQMYKEGLSKDDINNPLIFVSDENYKKLLDAGFKEHQFIYKDKKRRYIHLGWYQWIQFIKGWWIPNALKRSCCSTYKEGQVKLKLDKNKKYTILLGVRKYESSKRAFYEFNIRKAFKKQKDKEYNMPDNWETIAPICYTTDTDIWLYILMNDIEVNRMYQYGFNRVGCLICPYSSPYNNLLIKKFYPVQWNRWMNIVKRNYDIKAVKSRLKWDINEYTEGGKWRVGLSKEYEILSKKKTPERIHMLANLKGLSDNMAEKYWIDKCECGKKLNPDEIAMFYKLFGRFEDKTAQEDTRQVLCEDCLCKKLNITKEEYAERVKYFRQTGCELF